MLLSDNIAKVIEEMLEEGGGMLEFKRNDLANRLGCVPSQITYVISSRFTPERGYIIESHRGGGGYVRVVRRKMDKNQYLMHFFHAIGSSLSEKEAEVFLSNLVGHGVLTDREKELILITVSGSSLSALSPEARGVVRADIMRHVILTLMR